MLANLALTALLTAVPATYEMDVKVPTRHHGTVIVTLGVREGQYAVLGVNGRKNSFPVWQQPTSKTVQNLVLQAAQK